VLGPRLDDLFDNMQALVETPLTVEIGRHLERLINLHGLFLPLLALLTWLSLRPYLAGLAPRPYLALLRLLSRLLGHPGDILFFLVLRHIPHLKLNI